MDGDTQRLAEIVIENKVLLGTAIETLGEVKRRQEDTYLVSIQLREHNTIERVDKLWESLGQMRFLLRFITGLLVLLPVGTGVLLFTHAFFGWP